MNDLPRNLTQLKNTASIEKPTIISTITRHVKDAGYTIVEVNSDKPWGAYIRIANPEADRFVREFFPNLTPESARLGVEDAELSPKLLIVSPNQRLSWQYHNRRSECWMFLTAGAYGKSLTDDEGDIITAVISDVVQFGRRERHRLVGMGETYVVVAEIWQHSDPGVLSDESDIVRLADDYNR